MNTDSEKDNFNQERKREESEALKQAGAERLEELRQEKQETLNESPESLENARHEALERARSIEHESSIATAEKETRVASSPAERRNNGSIGRIERDASFVATMQEVQANMSPTSRTFSKIIHNKAVERVSDITASTIARPNAMLSGAIFAFILTLVIYLIAKNFGYPLSGFETIGAFILGWLIGILYDFLKIMVTGRK